MTALTSTADIMAPETPLLEGLLRDRLAADPAGPDTGPRVEVFARLASTSRHLLEAVADDDLPAPGRVCVAHQQTAGHGRRGRSWRLRPGDGLALSVAWPLKPGQRVPPRWPVVAGLELSEALRELGYRQVGLKWPNDLVADGAKLGGILVEQRAPGGPGGPRGRLVVGVGINRAGAVRLGLERAVTDLSALRPEPPPDWLELAALVAARLMRVHVRVMSGGPSDLAGRLPAVDRLAGRAVECMESGQRFHALGIDPVSGTLRVRPEAGGPERALHSGEVRLRGRDDG